jgi:hypothetical protein
VGEHDNLQPIVGHVLREHTVSIDHAFAKLVTAALQGQHPPRVPEPLSDWGVLTQPPDEVFRDLVIVDRIRIGRISDPDVANSICFVGRMWVNGCIRDNWMMANLRR